MTEKDLTLADFSKKDIERMARVWKDALFGPDSFQETRQVETLVRAAIIGNRFSVPAVCSALRNLAVEIELAAKAHVVENGNLDISQQNG